MGSDEHNSMDQRRVDGGPGAPDFAPSESSEAQTSSTEGAGTSEGASAQTGAAEDPAAEARGAWSVGADAPGGGGPRPGPDELAEFGSSAAEADVPASPPLTEELHPAGNGSNGHGEAVQVSATEAPRVDAPTDVLPIPPADSVRRRSHVAPALIPLDRIDEDDSFRIRPEGDTSLLATDIARVGQLYPIDVRLRPPDRFQIISGFRRVAALRFLQRERVLARLHTDLGDEDALLMSLAAAIHAVPVTREDLVSVRDRLQEQGRLSAALRDMLEKAISPDEELSPEHVEEEVDADELAVNATLRLGEINQDLALLADVFDSLDQDRKDELLQQLRYSVDLVHYLEGK